MRIPRGWGPLDPGLRDLRNAINLREARVGGLGRRGAERFVTLGQKTGIDLSEETGGIRPAPLGSLGQGHGVLAVKTQPGVRFSSFPAFPQTTCFALPAWPASKPMLRSTGSWSAARNSRSAMLGRRTPRPPRPGSWPARRLLGRRCRWEHRRCGAWPGSLKRGRRGAPGMRWRRGASRARVRGRPGPRMTRVGVARGRRGGRIKVPKRFALGDPRSAAGLRTKL